MTSDLSRLAERRMLAALAEGKLSHLAGEGQPLPAHPEEAYIDPGEAVGYRIMHEAGFVPQELELGKKLTAAREAWAAAHDEDEKHRLMGLIADLEMRRNMARETRLQMMHHR
jgi:DnaJ-like protein